MTRITKQAIRNLVNQALDGWPNLLWEGGGDITPINVNNVIDVQAAETDLMHQNYAPQNKAEFTVAIRRLLDSHPEIDYREIFQIVKSKVEDCDEGFIRGDNMNTQRKVEQILRKKIRSIIKEAAPAASTVGLKGWFGKDDEDGDEYKPRRKRGSDEEQAQAIVQTLKDQFGMDISSSNFMNYDKGTKLRFFATGYLSEKDPKFLERAVANYIEALEEAADEQGLLDDALIEELKDLEAELLEHPEHSEAFSEYLQHEVEMAIETMPAEKFNDLMDSAKFAFEDIPGGIMKYDNQGNEMPDHVFSFMKRRGGGPENKPVNRFRAALNTPAVPAVK